MPFMQIKVFLCRKKLIFFKIIKGKRASDGGFLKQKKEYI
jgi:hypothetical protein